MIAVLRNAALSYRALFTWLNPIGYISSRLVRPVGMAIVFTSIGSFYSTDTSRVLIGSSLLAGVGAVLYGMALSVGNERSFGTLRIWLATPEQKLAAVCRRAIPHIADGYLGGLCTYLVCCALYRSWPIGIVPFMGVLALAMVGACGLGLFLGALAFVVEDLFLGPNAAELVLMVLSGVLIPPQRLPGFLQPLTEIVPLSHLMGAVGKHLTGEGWDSRLLLLEAVTGFVWILVASLLMFVTVRRAAHRVE
ncbi:hypothetical protein DMB66_23170 [Actinoplanes sp. ATCC 53533]|uniref:ABC transporter permease n=1 Tax=Actinoplanes sp. ATCC 53533 TaxID=1288362 RepID=UPI000F78AF79|nr:ABC transporter permease [Actinoplanes sp. ATCC 53533]RSM61967.1 hypothetical protein DMB66_23170 [Actinoplanes sp. ATCC 53533]